MQDTVALANCLYDLKSLSPDHVQEALQIFKDERFSQVQEQYEASKVNAKLIYGQVTHTNSSYTAPSVMKTTTII